MRICPECQQRTPERSCLFDGTPTLNPGAFGKARKDVLVGRRLNERYEILERLPRAGVGLTYRARPVNATHEVSVKVIPAELVGTVESAISFIMRVKKAGALHSKHTVRVRDYGHCASGLYVTMEPLRGETLWARLEKRRTMAPVDAANMGLAVTESIVEASAAQITHGGINAHSVFFADHHGDDVVKVLDYGVAEWVRAAAPIVDDLLLTGAPPTFGPVAYMAPELLGSGEPKPKRDSSVLRSPN